MREEKEIRIMFQNAGEKGIITSDQHVKSSGEESPEIVRAHEIVFEKLKTALNDALDGGHINRKFVDMITEKPGSAEEMIRLTNELNMLTQGEECEKQQRETC
jgi:hypothetical protein